MSQAHSHENAHELKVIFPEEEAGPVKPSKAPLEQMQAQMNREWLHVYNPEDPDYFLGRAEHPRNDITEPDINQSDQMYVPKPHQGPILQ